MSNKKNRSERTKIQYILYIFIVCIEIKNKSHFVNMYGPWWTGYERVWNIESSKCRHKCMIPAHKRLLTNWSQLKSINDALLAQTTCSIYSKQNNINININHNDEMESRKRKKKISWNFSVNSEQWTKYEYVVQCVVVGWRYSDLFPQFFGYFYFFYCRWWWFFFLLVRLPYTRVYRVPSISNPVVIAAFLFDLDLYEKHFIAWSFLLDTWYIRMVGRSVIINNMHVKM